MRDFIGFDHYVRMFSDETFWKSLQVTSLFVLYKVPIQIVLSLALAVLLTRDVRHRRRPLRHPDADGHLGHRRLHPVGDDVPPQQGLIQSFLGIFGIPRQSFLSDADCACPPSP